MKSNASNGANPSVVSAFDYSVNNLGQRDDVSRSGSAFTSANTETWNYNAKGEVVTANHSTNNAFDRSFEFDGIGNRKKSADSITLPTADNYIANTLNQLTSVNGGARIHDADGNLTDDGEKLFIWDAENRLIEIKLKSDNSTVATYAYDYQSRRITKTVGATETNFVYDDWNPIAKFSGTTLSKSYTWGMDLSGSMQGAGGVGGLLSVNDGSATYYPIYDGNGNVSEYVDATGVVVAHYEYDAFGQVVASGTKADEFTHQFSTKQLDSESGLHYYGYRYYDPQNGRWINRDPIGEDGGINLYAFVGNEPIWHIDVLGLKTRKPCPFNITAGHAGDPDEPGNVDSREKDFNKNKGKCNSGRFYGASCFRSPDGGYVWPTPESRDNDPRAKPSNSTIGEEIRRKIKEAEKDAPKECADKKKCCSKIELKVTCLPDADDPFGGSMATARKKDPLARRACSYSNTYKCPNSKGKGGKWSKPLFK